MTRMVAVVLGGGVGTRFGAALPKQLLTLAGKTLVEHCVAAFAEAPGIDETVLVMPPDYHEEARKLVGGQVSVIIEGGVTRSDSVRNALAYLSARYPAADDRRPPPRRGPAAGHPADHRGLRGRAAASTTRSAPPSRPRTRSWSWPTA